jgi:Tol biopolymer transport system component
MRTVRSLSLISSAAVTLFACRGELAIGDTGDASSPTKVAPSGSGGTGGGGGAGGAGAGGAGVDNGSFSETDSSISGTPTGWIVFDSDQVDLIPHIFAISTDGSGLTQLTSGTSTDTEPTVSPDGTTLAFTSDRAGAPQIFAMNLTTRAVTQLTTASAGAGEAAFSPDGKTIAFNSNYGVSLVNSDGSDVRSAIVSPMPGFGGNYEHPVFSPSGSELVVDRLNEVDVFDLSGTYERSIVENWTSDELYPAISGDGAVVAFITDGCAAAENGVDDSLELTPFSDELGSPNGPCGGRPATALDLGELNHPSWGPGTFLAVSHVSSNGLYRVLLLDTSNPQFGPVEPLQNNGNQENPTWAPSTFNLSSGAQPSDGGSGDAGLSEGGSADSG